MGDVEIVIKVPEGVPKEVVERAKNKAIQQIREWLEFSRAAERVQLSKEDLQLLEEAREQAWQERKKELGL